MAGEEQDKETIHPDNIAIVSDNIAIVSYKFTSRWQVRNKIRKQMYLLSKLEKIYFLVIDIKTERITTYQNITKIIYHQSLPSGT